MAVAQSADIAVGGASEGPSGSDVFEITTTQRMASALTGSLFTSLLGKHHPVRVYHKKPT